MTSALPCFGRATKIAWRPSERPLIVLYCIVLYCIALYVQVSMTSALPCFGRATKRAWSLCERPLIVLYCIVLYCIALYVQVSMTSALPCCERATKIAWSLCERPLIVLYCIALYVQVSMTSALPCCERATKIAWSLCERPLIVLYCIVLYCIVCSGQYDKCVAMLRESNKDSMEAVRAAIFSHHHVAKKNELVIAIIDYVCRHEPGLNDDLQPILTRLTTLNKTENAKVALRARQVGLNGRFVAMSCPNLQLFSY